ncbi:PREDICTED: uncharacterized protein LOC109114513 [Nelumbo nucifera]|uniref:Uncharacterized protein LOC109114513 n=1 Tax=Nelumbo nucifera TaxID=4432 RepID=A0A1U8Q454_NELNU|nr:PREDICTED: uncharacterized protein LOC109114513 [Nelumbo nucifera]
MVIWVIVRWIHEASSPLNLTHKVSFTQQLSLQGLGLRIHPIKNKYIKVVHLLAVPEGYFKLNVDGASRGNPGPCGGGGIIRDGRNGLISAFSNIYGSDSNLVAEAMALLDGLHLLVALNLEKIMVELDSKLMIDILNSICAAPWKLWFWLSQVQELRNRLNFFCVHIYREANQPADALAKLGCLESQKTIYDCTDTLSSHVQHLITADGLGLSFLRIR